MISVGVIGVGWLVRGGLNLIVYLYKISLVTEKTERLDESKKSYITGNRYFI